MDTLTSQELTTDLLPMIKHMLADLKAVTSPIHELQKSAMSKNEEDDILLEEISKHLLGVRHHLERLEDLCGAAKAKIAIDDLTIERVYRKPRAYTRAIKQMNSRYNGQPTARKGENNG